MIIITIVITIILIIIIMITIMIIIMLIMITTIVAYGSLKRIGSCNLAAFAIQHHRLLAHACAGRLGAALRLPDCIDMCIDMRIHMCMEMCTDMCIDTCADMCIDTCIDMRSAAPPLAPSCVPARAWADGHRPVRSSSISSTRRPGGE